MTDEAIYSEVQSGMTAEEELARIKSRQVHSRAIRGLTISGWDKVKFDIRLSIFLSLVTALSIFFIVKDINKADVKYLAVLWTFIMFGGSVALLQRAKGNLANFLYPDEDEKIAESSYGQALRERWPHDETIKRLRDHDINSLSSSASATALMAGLSLSGLLGALDVAVPYVLHRPWDTTGDGIFFLVGGLAFAGGFAVWSVWAFFSLKRDFRNLASSVRVFK